MEQLMEEYFAVWKQMQVEKANGGVTEDTAKRIRQLEDAINKMERGIR